MDIDLIIEELNKIEGVKGKLKYLERIIFETKDKKLKEKLIEILKKIQKNEKKRLSFEEIHSGNAVEKKSLFLEEIVVSRTEKFDGTSEELKDYLAEPLSEELSAADEEGEFRLDSSYFGMEEHGKNDVYASKNEYKKDYKTKDANENFEFALSDTSMDIGWSANFESSPFRQNDTVEYKRKEILSKFVKQKEKERKEYLQKIRRGEL